MKADHNSKRPEQGTKSMTLPNLYHPKEYH